MVQGPTKGEEELKREAKDATRKNGAGSSTEDVEAQKPVSYSPTSPVLNHGKSIENSISTSTDNNTNTNLSLEEKLDFLNIAIGKLLSHLEEMTGDKF